MINKTWDNKETGHAPIKVHMNWHFERIPHQPHKRVIKVRIEAPLFDDPDPPNDFCGHVADVSLNNFNTNYTTYNFSFTITNASNSFS
jgi:hypothetical protein